MRKLLVIPFLLFLFTPFVSHAQSDAAIENTIGIGPRMGFYKADDADNGNFYGGLQGRVRLGPSFGLEGSIEYRAGQEYGFGTYSAKTKFVPVTASAMLFIPVSESFAPYGLAGLGAYYTVYDYSEASGFEDDESFNMGYHLGFGFELPMNDNVALNVDYRYLFLNPDENEENLDGASFSGNALTAGLMFYL